MNPRIQDSGAYASHVPAWLNELSAYIDVPWFIALTAWSLALMLWWSRPAATRQANWAWLPWSAGLGVVTVALHLSHLVFSRLGASPNGPFLWGDLTLGGIAASVALGWWWSALTKSNPAGGRSRAWIFCAVLAVPLGGAVALRYDFYDALYASCILTVACAVAALPWCLRGDASAWSRAAVIATALLPLCSTIGPVAFGFSMLERYTALSPAGFAGACCHAFVALLSLAGLARSILAKTTREARRELWRDARPIAIGAAVWLILAFTFAVLVSGRQRTRSAERALEQVRAMAFTIDPASLAPIESSAFRLDDIPLASIRHDAPIRYAYSDYLRTGISEKTDREFSKIARIAHTALYVRFVTLRDGWLVSPFNHHTSREGWVKRLSRSVGPDQPRLLLLRQPTPADLAAWEQGSGVIEGPIATPIMANSYIFVRAPVHGTEKRMVGWLEFTFIADEFLSETIQSRVAPLFGMTLGAIVAGMFFAQRRQSRVREAAVRAAAISAEANRVKTDFLAKVSHELRTPLQNLLGYSELLQADLDGETPRARLAALRQNGELMLRLVNDLLDLCAMEAGVFRLIEKPTALVELVSQTVESLRPRATAKKLSLHFSAAADLPAWLATDAERWRQIVLNLVGNAVKFTEHGSVDVSLSVIESLGSDKLLLELTVRDTGPGIPAKNHAQLFQPFSRLELTAKHEGAGLGLALVDALCRSAGGGVNVESDGHSGTCFRARFVVRVGAPPVPNSRVSEPSPSITGLHVLVVDDNTLVRELFTGCLRELGAICIVAVDGEQALALAANSRLDAVILDIALPGIDGISVARRWREEGRTWRIVGVSAHAGETERNQALAAGMDAFLVKPVELAKLVTVLGDVSVASQVERSKGTLRSHLEGLFLRELDTQSQAVRQALACGDWDTLKAHAHYLANSAGVVGDVQLYQAFGALEEAAARGDESIAQTVWCECSHLLAPWLERSLSPPART